MPYKFNPFTGNFDLVNAEGVEESFVKEAGEDISALKLIYQTDINTVEFADSTTYTESVVLGLSLNSAVTGNDVEILTYGQHDDAFFNFSLNEPLFLGSNGNITNVEPATGFVTQIGHGLGAGGIFIDIKRPIELC